MRSAIFLVIFLPFVTDGQSTFNKQFHFEYPAAALGNILPTDSCYYATGIVVDSAFPNLVGNIFVKFDLNGNEIFNKTLTSPTKYYDTWLGDLITTLDGNLLRIGQTTDTIFKGIIIKYNTQGDTIKTKEFLSPYYPQESFIVPFQVVQDNLGRIVVLNDVEMANGNNDLSLSIFDNELNLINHEVYGNQYDEIPGNSLIEDNGGFILGANRDNTNFVDKNFWSRTYLTKVDSLGDVEWQYLSPSFPKLQNVAKGFAKSLDGGLVIATSKGYEKPINAENGQIYWESAYFFKLDSNQQVVWELEVFDSISASPGNSLERLIPVDNGTAYIAAGDFIFIKSLEPPDGGRYGWLFKITDNGEFVWARKYQIIDEVGHSHKFYDLKQTFDGGFILAGSREGNLISGQPPLQAWLIKVDSFGCLVPGCQLLDETQEVKEKGTLLLYPNPATDYLNFFYRAPLVSKNTTFRIFDEQGRLMNQFESHQPEMTYIVPVDSWIAGVYFLQVELEGRLLKTEKFLIVR